MLKANFSYETETLISSLKKLNLHLTENVVFNTISIHFSSAIVENKENTRHDNTYISSVNSLFIVVFIIIKHVRAIVSIISCFDLCTKIN